jgi:murein DD-endopeptidase MepM/ murein hydrolase activator NlpD
LLLACLSLGSSAVRAEPISDRLARLSARIAALEASARLPGASSSSAGVGRPDGEESLRSQDLLRLRRGEDESELAEASAELRQSDRGIDELRAAMSARLVVIYKTRRAGQLPGLYSAHSFQSGLRVASDLGRVVEVDARLFERYRRAIAEREQRAERTLALAQRIARTELAFERQRRIDARNVLELTRLRKARAQQVSSGLRDVARELGGRLRGATPGETESAAAAPRRGTLSRPLAGPVRARFGARLIREFESVPKRTGIEIDAARGTPVRAVAAGRVIFAEALRGYGHVVILDHGGGLVSVCGHLGQRAVALGDRVETGQTLGAVGDSSAFDGPALYFELRENGLPVDPETWFE